MRLFFVILVLISLEAQAWGPTGHRVVGAIAERFLDPIIAVKVQNILRGESMAKVSTWPDEIRSAPETYAYTYPWHLTNWKDEEQEHDETNSYGKLLTAIQEQTAVLKDPGALPEKKNFALKFLVHLIGDLHQPLHVGNGLDQGGNTCKVTFHKKALNLHQLWDEDLIDFTRLSFTEMASFLLQGRKSEEIIKWRQGSLLDWARESKELRSEVYPPQVRPTQLQMSVKQYCRTDIVISSEDIPKLGYEYSYRFMPVVEKRLFQAGLRLALILNQTL
jgi:hypothetical protein